MVSYLFLLVLRRPLLSIHFFLLFVFPKQHFFSGDSNTFAVFPQLAPSEKDADVAWRRCRKYSGKKEAFSSH